MCRDFLNKIAMSFSRLQGFGVSTGYPEIRGFPQQFRMFLLPLFLPGGYVG
jgi:hypothetical protein